MIRPMKTRFKVKVDKNYSRRDILQSVARQMHERVWKDMPSYNKKFYNQRTAGSYIVDKFFADYVHHIINRKGFKQFLRKWNVLVIK